jgi:hypothetical protein
MEQPPIQGNPMLKERATARAVLVLIVLVSAVSANAQSRSPHQQLTFEIYRELVEINTVTATGDTAKAAEAWLPGLRVAGFTAPDLQSSRQRHARET